MTPEGLAGVPAWVFWLVGGGGLTALLGSVLVYVATRKRDRSTDISARWDDASELSQYIRKEIEQEVERQVAPIRAKLERVESESHQMNDAVRARETQLWLWDQRGRPGDLPMLPAPILHRLGLGHLTEGWQTEPS